MKIIIDTVLIVEDEAVSFEVLSYMLKDVCRHIIHVTNGHDAIEICRTNADIEMVLMDINIPFFDGHVATIIIKDFRPTLPIIAQTANNQIGDKNSFLENGFDDYIAKPVDKKRLLEIIELHLKK